jgi:biofilm protein TabA
MRWLLDSASTAELGTYQLGKNGWYANVHQYHTREQYKCVWESHQHTIDIQYILSGTERILWAPISQLEGPVRTLVDVDRQEWSLNGLSDIPPTSLEMNAGNFVIFMANEGHCPMIANGTPQIIRKTVIKIPAHLLSSN